MSSGASRMVIGQISPQYLTWAPVTAASHAVGVTSNMRGSRLTAADIQRQDYLLTRAFTTTAPLNTSAQAIPPASAIHHTFAITTWMRSGVMPSQHV